MSAQQDNSKPITMDDWYKCPLDRKVLKELTRRNDRDALLYLSGFLAMVAGSGVLASLSAPAIT